MWNGNKKAITFSYDDWCESDKKIIEILDKYGLKEFKDKHPSELSGGMRQRVG